jgi:hypothetical protein
LRQTRPRTGRAHSIATSLPDFFRGGRYGSHAAKSKRFVAPIIYPNSGYFRNPKEIGEITAEWNREIQRMQLIK